MTNREIINLFDQTKDLKLFGERISGEPEVLHEVQDWALVPANRGQIRKVLEFVPETFPEDWQSPEGYDELTPEQKVAYWEIAKDGISPLDGYSIQRIIEYGVCFRERVRQRMNNII